MLSILFFNVSNIAKVDSLKTIVDLKNKVSDHDFYDIYKTLLAKDDRINLNMNGLKRMKELDATISKIDYNLIRKIRKNERE
jgi:hypothetical protein